MIFSAASRYHVKTDGFGCRIPLGKKVDNRNCRIAGAGCSVMFGHGLESEDTMIELIGGDLGEPVCNMGVPGYSTVNALMRFEELRASVSPDILVYLYGDFHYARAIAPTAPSWLGVRFQPFLTRVGHTVFVRSPISSNQKTFELSSKLQELYLIPKSHGEEIHWNLPRFFALTAFRLDDFANQIRLKFFSKFWHGSAPSEAEFIKHTIDHLKQIHEAWGTKIILACLPRQSAACSEAMQKAGLDAEGRGDLIFVNLQKCLVEPVLGPNFKEVYQLNPKDSHPNARFQRETAQCIANQIRSAGWLVPQKEAAQYDRV